MDRRSAAIATKVADAITASGVPLTTISEATDIDLGALKDKLSGAVPFLASDLVNVGGFFRVPASHYMRGIA